MALVAHAAGHLSLGRVVPGEVRVVSIDDKRRGTASGRMLRLLTLLVVFWIVSFSVEELTRTRRHSARPGPLRLPAHLLDGLEEAAVLTSPRMLPGGRPRAPRAVAGARVDFEDPASVAGFAAAGVTVQHVPEDEQQQGGCLEVESTPGGTALVQFVVPPPTERFGVLQGKIRLHSRLSRGEAALRMREVRRLPRAHVRAEGSREPVSGPACVVVAADDARGGEGWAALLPEHEAINILDFGTWQPFRIPVVRVEGMRSLRVTLDVEVPLFSVRFDDLEVLDQDPLALVDPVGRYRFAAGNETTAPLRKMIRQGGLDRLSLLSVPGTEVAFDVELQPDSRLDLAATLWRPEGMQEFPFAARRLQVEVLPSGGEPLRQNFRFERLPAPSEPWRELRVDLTALPPGPARIRLRAPVLEGESWRAPPYLMIADPVVSAPDVGAEVRGVLLLTVDALSSDHVHALGYPRATTPVLDRLCKEGTCFAQATAPSPSTYTSLPSILASSHRRDHWRSFAATLAPETPTLPEVLTRGGFLVAPFIADFYFNSFFKGFYQRPYAYAGAGGSTPERMDQLLAEQLEDFVRRADGRRFFAWLHTFQPHGPNRPDEAHRVFRGEPEVAASLAVLQEFFRQGGVPGTREVEEAAEQISIQREKFDPALVRHAEVVLTALYDESIHQVDALLDTILATLEAEGILDRVIIAISSDHGWPLAPVMHPDRVLPEGALVVPLLLRGPGIPAGLFVEERVSTVDIAPTLLELAGREIPAAFEGVSLAPLLRGDSVGDRLIPAQSATHVVGWKGRYKLVLTRERFDPLDSTLTLPADGAWLFDRVRDPEERHDVLAEHAAEANMLLRELQDWYRARPGSFRSLELTDVMKGHLRAAGYY